MMKKTGSNKTLVIRLVEEELGFCCICSFLKETRRWSAHKVSEAMGLSANSITYWRSKKFYGKVKACPQCPLPQTQLLLKKTASGRAYFARSFVR